MPAPHPLARRIHDRALQLLGTALLEAEMCEKLAALGRHDQVVPHLAQLRACLDNTIVEMQAIVAELRDVSPVVDGESLASPAA